jgi:hypothetical protein
MPPDVIELVVEGRIVGDIAELAGMIVVLLIFSSGRRTEREKSPSNWGNSRRRRPLDE